MGGGRKRRREDTGRLWKVGKWLWVTMEGCSSGRAVGTYVRQQALKTMNGPFRCKGKEQIRLSEETGGEGKGK